MWVCSAVSVHFRSHVPRVDPCTKVHKLFPSAEPTPLEALALYQNGTPNFRHSPLFATGDKRDQDGNRTRNASRSCERKPTRPWTVIGNRRDVVASSFKPKRMRVRSRNRQLYHWRCVKKCPLYSVTLARRDSGSLS